MLKTPRTISPSLIDFGDLIAVEHPVSGGITTTYKGRARRRSTQGSVHAWHTEEGSILVSWESDSTPSKVTLLDREPVLQTPLEGFNFA